MLMPIAIHDTRAASSREAMSGSISMVGDVMTDATRSAVVNDAMIEDPRS